ncbi:MAG: hypothetical protein JXP34_04325, partial [Planctomycetes bacterium]|nr:hypothetical protein [Planctomycetota bacterium]
VVGEGEIFIVARNPGVFEALYGDRGRVFGPYTGRLDNDGEVLRVRDAGPGHPATVDFVHYETSGDWPPQARGLGYSLELTGVEPWRDNDPGENWRASILYGGSPGEIEGINFEPSELFVRGDANQDGVLDLSDPVRTLLHLFQGAPILCEDAADADDSGTVEITDAIFGLAFLFRGGSAPPAPFPICGADSSEDSLTCESYAPCP